MSAAKPMTIPARWSRDLLFHAAGLLTTTVGLAFWTGAVITSAVLAITYVGLVVTLATLLACRWFARVERRRAGIVLGAPIPEHYEPLPPAGLTSRLHTLIGKSTTWRDFAWTGLAGIAGPALSGIAIVLWGCVAGLITLPAWYWSLPNSADLGFVDIDRTALAFAATAAGLVLVPVAGQIVRGLTVAEIALMRLLLEPRGAPAADAAAAGPREAGVGGQAGAGGEAGAEADAGAWPDAGGSRLGLPLDLHVALSVLVSVVVTLIWAAGGLGYFWPIWVWLALALLLVIHVIAIRERTAAPGPQRALRLHAQLSGTLAVLLVIIWAITGGGIFWPFFAVLGLGVVFALHALFVYRDRLPLRAREQALAERVDVLTRTRRGALDVQAAELRRIERDLHDGAQARLVSLTIQLGRAEERVADQPEVAALLRSARADAGAAIAELRDLARGIAPPILADRGLAAAVEALGRRAAIDVTVDADPDQRPLPVVETAAYFVAAEALTNVVKHGGGAGARVRVHRAGDQLVVEVADDGPGGADPHGGGLTGLRHRVEALDGTLTITSPPGGGTTVRAEMPCGP